MRPFKPLDFFAVMIAAGVTFFSFFYAYGTDSAASHLVVKATGEEWIYSLDAPKTLEFDGPLGITKVQIVDEGAHVVSSPCRDKICILAGHLDGAGDWTACLPNRFFMKISGDENQPIDEISY